MAEELEISWNTFGGPKPASLSSYCMYKAAAQENIVCLYIFRTLQK